MYYGGVVNRSRLLESFFLVFRRCSIQTSTWQCSNPDPATHVPLLKKTKKLPADKFSAAGSTIQSPNTVDSTEPPQHQGLHHYITQWIHQSVCGCAWLVYFQNQPETSHVGVYQKKKKTGCPPKKKEKTVSSCFPFKAGPNLKKAEQRLQWHHLKSLDRGPGRCSSKNRCSRALPGPLAAPGFGGREKGLRCLKGVGPMDCGLVAKAETGPSCSQKWTAQWRCLKTESDPENGEVLRFHTHTHMYPCFGGFLFQLATRLAILGSPSDSSQRDEPPM